MPESDKPRDFEIQGTWGGAGFLIGACIKYCAYLGAGEEGGKKMPTPSPVPFKNKILKDADKQPVVEVVEVPNTKEQITE